MSRRAAVRDAAAALAACLLLAPAVSSAAVTVRTGASGPDDRTTGVTSSAGTSPGGTSPGGTSGGETVTAEAADLVVTSMTPLELRPDAPVTVTGRVEGGPTGLSGAQVQVRLASGRSTSVSSLQQWTAPVADTEAEDTDETEDDGAVDDPARSARTEVELELGDVRPSRSVPFTLVLEAEDLGLRPVGSSAGPYGLQLLLLAGDEVVDDERGFLVWSPPVQASPTLLSTTVTLLGPPAQPETGLPEREQLVQEVSPGGRLTRLLDAAVALDADWLLDPTLLAGAAEVAGRGPTDAEGTGPDEVGPDEVPQGEPTQEQPGEGRPSQDRQSQDPAAGPGAGPSIEETTTSEATTEARTGTEASTGPGPGPAATDPPAGDDRDDTDDLGDPSDPDDPSDPAPTGQAPPDLDAADPQEAAEAAARWLDVLREGRGSREVVLTDWADPDPIRIRSASDPDDVWAVLRSAREAALPEPLVEELLDGRARDDVLVATEGRVTLRDLATLAEGRSSLLLREDTVPLQDPFALSYTPDDVTEVRLGGAAAGPGATNATAVLADPDLAADAVQALEGSPLAATRVLARLATTTLQRPNDSRLLGLTLPAQLLPAPGAAERLAAAVEDSQWVQPVSLSTALGRPPSQAPRARPPLGSPTAPLPGVQQLLDAVADGREVADALGRPVDAGAAGRLDLRAAATLSGRVDPGAPAALAEALAVEARQVVEGVRVVPGSRITLAAAQAGLPVTVVNDLGTEVRLVLRVRSRSPRLQVQDAELPVTVPPGQRAVMDVPVRAVASGRAEVTTQLVTEDGREWGRPATVTVTVATQVEGRVLGAVGGVVAVLFVLGAVRAFVRNRRGRELEKTGQVQP